MRYEKVIEILFFETLTKEDLLLKMVMESCLENLINKFYNI